MSRHTTLSVREVKTRSDLRRFINFPHQLYRSNKYWIPPLWIDERKTLDSRTNPAFRHCRAKYLLAEREGRVVGRVAGIINQKFVEKWGQTYCRFGWFDFEDDVTVSRALLTTVEDWARDHGMTAVHGPLGFTDLDREGMLVEGFEELGTMATLYNLPYYGDHMSKHGYKKDVDWVEFEVKTPREIPEKALRVHRIVLDRFKLRIVPPRKKVMMRYARKMFYLINEAYADLYGFIGLSEEQIDLYVKQYLGFIEPDFVRFIVDEDDELVAFGIAMPSLSRALQRSRGRLLPLGFLRLLRALKFPRQIDLLLIAVRPDFQGKGIPAILMTEITQSCIHRGIVSAETNIELETNAQVQALWKHFDARQHKRRRCYIKHLS